MGSTQLISIKTVLAEINMNPAETFAITLVTEDGRISHKPKVKKNPGKTAGFQAKDQKQLSTIQRNQRRTATMKLYNCIAGHPFDAKIRTITHYNGQRIFHNY